MVDSVTLSVLEPDATLTMVWKHGAKIVSVYSVKNLLNVKGKGAIAKE